MVFSFGRSRPNSTDPAGGFTPLPGSFLEEGHGGSEGTEVVETNRGLPRLVKVSLHIPLIVLYYVLNFILTLAEVFKPFGKVFHFYSRKNKYHNDDLGSQFTSVVDLLSASHVTDRDTGHSFESLYNLETGELKSYMIRTGYTGVLQKCSKDGKFAIIYFHDPVLYEPYEYVSRLLVSSEFVECVKRFNCMVWFCDVTTPQGLQCANSLKIRQFPFLGVLEPQRTNKMKLVTRVEGRLFDYDVSQLDAKLAKCYPYVLEIRRQRQAEEMERILREQQDSRYQSSLQRDQQRDQQRERAAQESKLKQSWLLWRKSIIRPEPSSGGCRVSIRLQNERIVRRFDPSLAIEEIYAFVALRQAGMLTDEVQDTQQPHERPEYHYQYEFQLYSPAPRTHLEPSCLIRDEPTIFPSGTIMVESQEQ